MELDADQIMALMEGLAQIRANMLPEIPDNFRARRPKGDGNAMLMNPKIEVVKPSNGPIRFMAIRSAAYGWIAVALKEEEIGALISQLTGETDISYLPSVGNA